MFAVYVIHESFKIDHFLHENFSIYVMPHLVNWIIITFDILKNWLAFLSHSARYIYS